MSAPAPDPARYACPMCHAPLTADNGAFACKMCGALYPLDGDIPLLVPQAAAHLADVERAVARNPAWYESSQLAWYDHGPCRHHLAQRKRYVESVLAERLAPGKRAKRLLDLGCGDGANTRWLIDWAEEIEACDYNVLRLRRCRRLIGSRVALCLADVHRLPWIDNRFDIVFFNHVLEHIDDDIGALQSVGRILKPGGLLILGVPNSGCACMQLAYRLQPSLVAHSDHVRDYTAPQIEDRVRQAGLQVLHTEHIGWGVPHLKLDETLRNYRRIDAALSWLGRRLAPRQSTSLYVLIGKNASPGQAIPRARSGG